jgi:hypothetical protein
MIAQTIAGLGAPPEDRAGFIDWQVRAPHRGDPAAR